LTQLPPDPHDLPYPGLGNPCPHDGGKIAPGFRCAACAKEDRARIIAAPGNDGGNVEAAVTPSVFDTELELYCLKHRKRVRWLAAPTWWYHVADNRTCRPMWNDHAPRVSGLAASPCRVPLVV